MCWRTKRIRKMPLVSLALFIALLVPQSVAAAAEAEAEDALASDFAEEATDSAETSAGGGSAQDTSQPPSERPAAGSRSKLSVHGFLTQAYAVANFDEGVEDYGFASPTFFELNLGIPEEGTTSYRFLALQFRYDITPKDVMVVQLSSRALGINPASEVEDDIELDWAFYERRLTDHLSLKIGRVQIPLGIYNEIRDVGTILPFYRPPYNFYSEGSFTSETVDGLALSTTFWPSANWNLDATIYGGEWELFETHVGDPSITGSGRAEDAYGIQLWLNTSVPGLRVGFGANSRVFKSEIYAPPEGIEDDRIVDWYVSLDASFSRVVFRAEYTDADPVVWLPFGKMLSNTLQYYAQFGYMFNDKFHVWLQHDVTQIHPSGPFFVGGRGLKRKPATDSAIALDYFFAPNLVLKAEYHKTEQENVITVPVFTPGGLLLQDIAVVDFDGGDYTIVSFSVSF